jgi:hypothetical protein
MSTDKMKKLEQRFYAPVFRVTGLLEFPPIRWLFTLVIFFENYMLSANFWATFPTIRVVY